MEMTFECDIKLTFKSSTLSKKDGKDQKTIQSSTITDPGYHMGKWQKYNKHHQQEVSPFPVGDHKAAKNRRE